MLGLLILSIVALVAHPAVSFSQIQRGGDTRAGDVCWNCDPPDKCASPDLALQTSTSEEFPPITTHLILTSTTPTSPATATWSVIPEAGDGISVDLSSNAIVRKGNWTAVADNGCPSRIGVTSSFHGAITSGSGAVTSPVSMSYNFTEPTSVELQLSTTNAQWNISLNGHVKSFSGDGECIIISNDQVLSATGTNAITISLLGAPTKSQNGASGQGWSFKVARLLIITPPQPSGSGSGGGGGGGGSGSGGTPNPPTSFAERRVVVVSSLYIWAIVLGIVETRRTV